MRKLRLLIASQVALSRQLTAIRDSQDTGGFTGPAFVSARERIADRLHRAEQQIALFPVQLVDAERAHQTAAALRAEADTIAPPAAMQLSGESVDTLRTQLEALRSERAAALLPHVQRLRRYAGDEREVNASIRAHAQTRIDAINAQFPAADLEKRIASARVAERTTHFERIARDRADALRAEAAALVARYPDRPTLARGADRTQRRDRATRVPLPPDLPQLFVYEPASGALLRTYRRDALVTGRYVKVRGAWYPVLEIIAALLGTTDKLTLRKPNEPPALSNLLRNPTK